MVARRSIKGMVYLGGEATVCINGLRAGFVDKEI
jgi:radical SAM modification target selenobiotic family peptide